MKQFSFPEELFRLPEELSAITEDLFSVPEEQFSIREGLFCLRDKLFCLPEDLFSLIQQKRKPPEGGFLPLAQGVNASGGDGGGAVAGLGRNRD